MSPLVGGFRLDEAVADVFGDLRLAPVLRRLLRHTRRLTGSVAGSVSLVDAEHGSYVKVAEYGDFCRLGDRFPLDEGATGQAYDERQPVVIPDYGRMPTNHLHGRHPGRKGPAAAVPIWWRGDVIAVNVAFTGQGGRFSAREVDDLEALTQTAAAAIIQSGRRDASPAGEIRRRFAGHQPVVTEVGLVRPVSPELARAAADLVTAAARRQPHPRLHVAIVYRPQGLRVLVQDEGTGSPAGEPDPLGMGTTTWDELLRRAGGGVTIEEVRGWGVLLRADLPYSISAELTARPSPTPSTQPAAQPDTEPDARPDNSPSGRASARQVGQQSAASGAATSNGPSGRPGAAPGAGSSNAHRERPATASGTEPTNAHRGQPGTASDPATSNGHHRRPGTGSGSESSNPHRGQPGTAFDQGTSNAHRVRPGTASGAEPGDVDRGQPGTASDPGTSNAHRMRPTTASGAEPSTAHRGQPGTASSGGTGNGHRGRPATDSGAEPGNIYGRQPGTDSGAGTSNVHRGQPGTASGPETGNGRGGRPGVGSGAGLSNGRPQRPGTDSGAGPGNGRGGRPGTGSGAGLAAESGASGAYGMKAQPTAEPAPFTPREGEVLGLLRQGLTDREIAGRLVLSAKTVEKHVGAIMRKTKTTNRTAAVMTALAHDW